MTKLKSKSAPQRANFFDELPAHRLDALAHLAELVFPQLAQLRRGQDGRDDLAAVSRRVRIVGADHALELAQHARRFFGAAGRRSLSAPTRSP